MRKTGMTLFLLAVLFPATWAKDKTTPIKVQVAESEGFQGKEQKGGVVGLAIGSRTFATGTTIKVTINGDHALLKCYEHHGGGCNMLGPGEYDADMKTNKDCYYCSESDSEPDVWLHYVRPVDHKVFRQHWKVVGSW